MILTNLVIAFITVGLVVMNSNLKEFCSKSHFDSVSADYPLGLPAINLNRKSDSKIKMSYHSWVLMIEKYNEIYKTIHMSYTLMEGNIPDSPLSQPNYCPIPVQTIHEMAGNSKNITKNIDWSINDFIISNDSLNRPQINYTQMVFQTFQHRDIFGQWHLDSRVTTTEETMSHVLEIGFSDIPLSMIHVLSGGNTLCRLPDKTPYVFVVLTNQMNTSDRTQFVTRLKITGMGSKTQERKFTKTGNFPHFQSERTTRPHIEFSLVSMNKTIHEFLGIDCKNIEGLFNVPIPTPEFGATGYYPYHQYLDINLPECGINLIPISSEIHFSSNCFRKQLENKRFLSFDSTQEDLINQISNRIFRGQDAKPPAESPWTVKIHTVFGPISSVCTGVLVTFKWVLTSAHCLKKFPKDIQIGIGRDSRDFIEVRYSNRDHFYPHPIHDIALIKLKSPFSRHLNDGIQYLINTICLPNAVVNTEFEDATYFGWGLTDDKGRYPDILQKGQAKVFPSGVFVCDSKSFCTYYKSPVNKLLWGGEYPYPSRPCLGDSGGPLLKQIYPRTKRNVLIGIFETGTSSDASIIKENVSCSADIAKASWAAVPHFIDWILTTIGLNN